MNYHLACEYCVRSRGLADKHKNGHKDESEYMDGHDEVPEIGADFCFLSQREE